MQKVLFNLLTLVLAAGLVLMLAMTVGERIANPSLVKHVAQAPTPPPAARDESPLAALMRRAGEEPNNPAVQIEIGRLLIEQGSFEQAKTFLEKAALLDVNNADIPYLLGFAAAQLGDTDGAIASFEDCLRLQDRGDAHYSLGILYAYARKDAAKARAHLEKALASPEIGESMKTTVQQEIAKLDNGATGQAEKQAAPGSAN